jgi:hypothetical protein
MVRSDAHQGLIGRGCSHFLAPAVVTVDGGDAIAVCESVLLMRGRVAFPQEYKLSTLQLDGRPHPPNDGVNLMAAMSSLEEALDTRISLIHHLHMAQDDAAGTEAQTAQRMLERNSEQIEAIRKQIRETREALWVMRSSAEEVRTSSDD